MPALVVHPVRFTSRPDVFRQMLAGLGAAVSRDRGDEVVYRAGSGFLEIRAVGADDPRAGVTVMRFTGRRAATVPPAFGSEVPGDVRGAGGRRVAAADGLVVEFGSSSPPPAPTPDRSSGAECDPVDPALSVVPIWMTGDVQAASDALTSLGFARRLSSDSGVWVDLVGRGETCGLVAVHRESGEPDVILALEYTAELTVLHDRMGAHGIETPLVDESFSRTLRLPDPDNDGQIWVNEAMTDMYGYQRG